MKIKCYSVRLAELKSVSPSCFLAKAFDGTQDLIPRSQVYGADDSVSKSDAYWISAWILEKKQLQYSIKKEAWFDKESGKMLPSFTVERHIPAKVEPINKQPDESLTR